MQEKKQSLIKLVNYLYRHTQAYIDGALLKYELSSGTYPFLLTLYENEGISQNQISKELNIDKAMSARAIKKLVELDYVRKEKDPQDDRACRLFLTNKAKDIIPEVIKEIHCWINLITNGLSDEEKELEISYLSKNLENAKKQTNKNNK